jgi:hypothetical protein
MEFKIIRNVAFGAMALGNGYLGFDTGLNYAQSKKYNLNNTLYTGIVGGAVGVASVPIVPISTISLFIANKYYSKQINLVSKPEKQEPEWVSLTPEETKTMNEFLEKVENEHGCSY